MKFFLTLFTIVCCSLSIFAQEDTMGQKESELLHGPCSVKRSGSKRSDDRFYIDMKGRNVTIYMEAASRIFSGTLKEDNTLDAFRDFGRERDHIVCTFTENKVTGRVESWDVFDPDDKDRWEFEAVRDSSLEAEQFWQKYLKKWFDLLARFNPDTWWDATPERQEDKKLFEMLREKNCAEFDIRGTIVNPQGEPIPGVVIGISCRAWGLLDPAGLYVKRQYITTDENGKFESLGLIAETLSIIYAGKKYEHINWGPVGKEAILKAVAEPIVITLTPAKPKTDYQ